MSIEQSESYIDIRNQACREQQIQQTKADVVKKEKTRKITSRKRKKREHLINIYPMYIIFVNISPLYCESK